MQQFSIGRKKKKQNKKTHQKSAILNTDTFTCYQDLNLCYSFPATGYKRCLFLANIYNGSNNIAEKEIAQIIQKPFGRDFQYEILLINNQVLNTKDTQKLCLDFTFWTMFKIHYVNMKAIKVWLHQYRRSISIQREFIVSKDNFILNSSIHKRSNKPERLKVISNVSELAVYKMALSKDFPSTESYQGPQKSVLLSSRQKKIL